MDSLKFYHSLLFLIPFVNIDICPHNASKTPYKKIASKGGKSCSVTDVFLCESIASFRNANGVQCSHELSGRVHDEALCYFASIQVSFTRLCCQCTVYKGTKNIAQLASL